MAMRLIQQKSTRVLTNSDSRVERARIASRMGLACLSGK